MRLAVARSWIIILLAILGGIAGFFYARSQPVEFSAEQQLLETGEVLNPLLVTIANDSIDPTRLVQTQADILSGDSLRRTVEERLGRVAGTLEAQTNEQSDVLLVSVVDSSAERADESLQVYLRTFLDQIEDQEVSKVDAALDALDAQLKEIEARLDQTSSSDDLARSGLIQQQITVLGQKSELEAARELGATSIERVGRIEVSEEALSERSTAGLGAALGALAGLLIVVALAQLKSSRAPQS